MGIRSVGFLLRLGDLGECMSCTNDLNVEAMRTAAKHLVGTHDF